MEQQIYSSNSTRPFPLAEGSDVFDLDDVFVDMSITVPIDVVPVITAIAITPSTFFAALEDVNTKEGIGQITVTRPKAFSVNRFDMPMGGAFGWVVLGGGINTPRTVRDVDLKLDPSVIMRAPLVPNSIMNVKINGREYPISGIMGLDSLSNGLNISSETRTITDEGNNESVHRCIVLSRDDAAFTQEQIFHGFSSSSNINGAILKIAGASPSISGDIDIRTDPGFPTTYILSPSAPSNIDERIGFLFNQNVEVCKRKDIRKRILHGRCEQGISTDDGLPCDPLVEILHPEFKEDDCGCDDSRGGPGPGWINGGGGPIRV